MGESCVCHQRDNVSHSLAAGRRATKRTNMDRREPRDYLQHVMSATNMGCLTPEGALSGDCDFLSANLYARSLFGACLSAGRTCVPLNAGGRRGRAREPECREDTNGADGPRPHPREDAGNRAVPWRPHHDG
jgi:hypothetical protein